MMPPQAPSSWRELDRRVQAYEQSLRAGRADWTLHLPTPGDPLFAPVLRELILVDAEWHSERGETRTPEHYLDAHPVLASDRLLRSSIRAALSSLARIDSAATSRSDPDAAADRRNRAFGLEPGTRLGLFVIRRRIACGAFAAVYLAHQPDLADRPVALKVSARSLHEPQKLARLQHTHIVPLHSAHETEGLSVLCMPYLGETTLAARMKREPGGFDPRTVLRWCLGLASGLGHAHERGLLHLDVKPANVLLSDDGVPMLLDFNLAASHSKPSTARPSALPWSHGIGGTAAYMSPEQLQQWLGPGAPPGPESDVYALGLLMWELLTGRPAYPLPAEPDDASLRTLLHLRQAGPPDVSGLPSRVAPSVRAILRRCLEPDRSRRYASGNELADDLGRELADLPLRHAGRASLLETAGKWVRRHPRKATAGSVGCLALILLAAGTVAYTRQSQKLASARLAQAITTFDTESQRAWVLLGMPTPTPAQISEGVKSATRALALFGYLPPDHGHSLPVLKLQPSDRPDFDRRAGELLVLASRGKRLESQRLGGPSRDKALEQARALNRQALAVFDSPLARRQSVLLDSGASAPPTSLPSDEGQDNARLLYLQALEHIGDHRWSQASGVLRQAVDADPRDPALHAALGHTHLALADPRSALAAWETAAALAPENDILLHLVGVGRFLLADHAGAETAFTRCLALNPDLHVAYADRGLLRLSTGDLPGAISDLTESLRRDPGHTRALFLRAKAHELRQDFPSADQDRASALEATPRDEQSMVTRAIARLPNTQAARTELLSTLEHYPDSLDALQNLAYVDAELLADPERAVQWLTRLLDSHPEHLEALTSRAVLYARTGDRARALADAERALAKPLPPARRYQLAGAYAHFAAAHPADADESLRLLRSALADGYGFDLLETDPDLRPLHHEERFLELRNAAKTLRPPTPTDQRFP